MAMGAGPSPGCETDQVSLMSLRSALDHLRQAADAPAIRWAGALLAGSLVIVFAAVLSSSAEPCEIVAAIMRRSETHSLAIMLVLAALWFGLFLTFLPLGTSSVMAFGYLLGPQVGIVQFAALVAASAVLFEVSRDSDQDALAARLQAQPALLGLAQRVRRRGLWFSSLLRLVPVAPSAAASLAGSYFHLSRRDFYGGTLLAGWVRPVVFAWLGAAAADLPICSP